MNASTHAIQNKTNTGLRHLWHSCKFQEFYRENREDLGPCTQSSDTWILVSPDAALGHIYLASLYSAFLYFFLIRCNIGLQHQRTLLQLSGLLCVFLFCVYPDNKMHTFFAIPVYIDQLDAIICERLQA